MVGKIMVLNRNRQKEYLEQFYNRNGSHLVVMYGAKGAGKTSLLKDFMQGKAHCYYQARPCSDREQVRLWSMEYSRQPGKAFHEEPETTGLTDFDGIISELVRSPDTGEKLLLVLDEFHYMVRGGGAFMQSMVRLLHHAFSERDVLIVLCSSCVGWVENSMVNRLGEAAFEISGFLKIRELGFEEIYRYFDGAFSTEELLVLYSVMGGIPGYWRMIDRNAGLRENLCRLFLEPDGAFQREARELVESQLRETSVYHTILSVLAQGKSKLNDLYHATGFSRAKISVYLKNLMELELVEKVFSFDSEGRENTQKGVYRIGSHLVRFYFRFLYPNLSALSLSEPEEFYEQYVKPELEKYTAGIFGKVCAQYMEQENQKGTLPISFEKSGEWVGKMGTLDLVAQDEEGHTLICGCFGEAPVLPYAKYEEWMECMRAARLSADELYLFAKEGFDERVEALAGENEKVHTVAWTNLYL